VKMRQIKGYKLQPGFRGRPKGDIEQIEIGSIGSLHPLSTPLVGRGAAGEATLPMIMTPTIFPVILPVPIEARDLPPGRRVRFLGRHAREALMRSAKRLQVELGPLEKDPRGAPLPSNGLYWSVTHKPEYVGGVASRSAVGLDLEKIRPCSEALYRKTASAPEWALAGENDREQLFFRYWTAKEAVLKTGGEGIKDLSGCRVRQVIDASHLLVDYAGRSWTVEQVFFGDHVASAAGWGVRLEWVFPD
jgi:4'-phosphopantetheinyl transferase